MSKTFVLSGRPYRYRYGIRAFMAFEHISGRTYSGSTISDQILMMGCTLYDADGNNPALDRLTDSLDACPKMLKEWIALFARDAERWAKAYEGDTDQDPSGTQASKKKE